MSFAGRINELNVRAAACHCYMCALLPHASVPAAAWSDPRPWCSKNRLCIIIGCIVLLLSAGIYKVRVLSDKTPLDTYGSLQYIISILSNIF
jgi:hypothetical protein